MNFESDLREILNAGDMDKLDLYKRGIGLSVTDLDEAEKRMINTYRQEYRDKGFIGGFKDSLRRIGIMQEAKGGMNLFKNIYYQNITIYKLNCTFPKIYKNYKY